MRLTVLVDGKIERTEDFNEESITIGKGPVAMLRIDDPFIGDLHAVINVDFLESTNSVEAVMLCLGAAGGLEFEGNDFQRRVLQPDDVISLSERTAVVFESFQAELLDAEADTAEDAEDPVFEKAPLSWWEKSVERMLVVSRNALIVPISMLTLFAYLFGAWLRHEPDVEDVEIPKADLLGPCPKDLPLEAFQRCWAQHYDDVPIAEIGEETYLWRVGPDDYGVACYSIYSNRNLTCVKVQ